jgi:hypothetical protein
VEKECLGNFRHSCGAWDIILIVVRMGPERRGMELDTKFVMCARLNEDESHMFFKGSVYSTPTQFWASPHMNFCKYLHLRDTIFPLPPFISWAIYFFATVTRVTPSKGTFACVPTILPLLNWTPYIFAILSYVVVHTLPPRWIRLVK